MKGKHFLCIDEDENRAYSTDNYSLFVLYNMMFHDYNPQLKTYEERAKLEADNKNANDYKKYHNVAGSRIADKKVFVDALKQEFDWYKKGFVYKRNKHNNKKDLYNGSWVKDEKKAKEMVNKILSYKRKYISIDFENNERIE